MTIDLIYDLEVYKRCSRGIECCHPDNIDGWLFRSEFYRNKSSKDGCSFQCKKCDKYYHTRHRTIDEPQSMGNGQYRDIYHVITRRRSQANSNAKKTRNNKQSTMGNGQYNGLWEVIGRRKCDCNRTAREYNLTQLTQHECVALLISQSYKCPITNIDLYNDFVRLSPDHIISFDNGGDNDINNIVWMHQSINHGKNGDTMDYIIDITLRVAYPNDDIDSISKRKQRLDEVMENIWKAHDIYPQVYEKIKDLTAPKLKLLLYSKISAIDLLNT